MTAADTIRTLRDQIQALCDDSPVGIALRLAVDALDEALLRLGAQGGEDA